ncbi:hypothetical protein OXX59_005534 [Metschnikowia pulcherrima]
MEDAFFFALLRISIAQILKSAGFDKCKPSVLHTVTDLYIKHLELVIGKAKKFAVARTSSVNEMTAQDVAEALLDIGFLKPIAVNDPEGRKNTKSIESFKNWVKYSDTFAVSKRLSAVPSSLLANLAEKRKIDTSSETDQERKKRRLRERQEYFNQLKQGEESGKTEKNELDDLDEDEITANDKISWLAYLAEKDLKLGQNMKYVNTCIQDDLSAVHKLKKFHPTPIDGEDSYSVFQHHAHNSTKNDHFVLQLQEDEKPDADKGVQVVPPAELKSVLPYNLKYEDSLVDEDLSQYLQYAEAHKDEIEERLGTVAGENTDEQTNKDEQLIIGRYNTRETPDKPEEDSLAEGNGSDKAMGTKATKVEVNVADNGGSEENLKDNKSSKQNESASGASSPGNETSTDPAQLNSRDPADMEEKKPNHSKQDQVDEEPKSMQHNDEDDKEQ